MRARLLIVGARVLVKVGCAEENIEFWMSGFAVQRFFVLGFRVKGSVDSRALDLRWKFQWKYHEPRNPQATHPRFIGPFRTFPPELANAYNPP